MIKSFAVVVSMAGVLLLSVSAFAENVEKVTEVANVVIWKISEPTVTQAETSYNQVQFKPGDTVNLSAGGCVQTGGHGATWKRYVDPLGNGSDKYYFGTIKLPGMPGHVRVSEFMSNMKNYKVADDASGDMTLHLGYPDDNYGDNGYYKHDDGNSDQCKNVGNAWVQLVIVHKP